MSIYAEINEMVRHGRLHHLSPVMPGTYTKRRMYVTTEIQSFVDDENSRQGNALRAVIDRYLTGNRVTVSKDKDADVNLKQLTPIAAEIWEIRSKKERPATRVFGSFVQKDMFVGLTWAFRPELGAIHSKEWKFALQQYKYEWHKLFPTYAPLSGETFDDYLSNILPL